MKGATPYRILQVGMSPYYGGTEAFLMNQYRKLDRTKIQFDFLNVFSQPIACEQEIEELGGKIYHLNMQRHKGLKQYYRNLDHFFREHSGKFHAIHCNLQSLVNVDLLKYAKKYAIPVRIAHAHNAGYGKEPGKLQKLLIFLNKRTVKRCATHYFACSELAAKWMFNAQATVINNAIDARVYRFCEQTRNELRAEMGLGKEPVVIFVGRLDPQKNPIFLLEIFKELLTFWEDAKLLVVGDGILRPQMETFIVENGLQSGVAMLGTRGDVSRLLQAADVFLLPSRFEGLGIVLVEAQAAGMPAFTSKDVVPEAVKITDFLEFIPLTHTPLQWAQRIAENANTARQDSLEAVIRAGYDTAANAQKLQKLYISMLEEDHA